MRFRARNTNDYFSHLSYSEYGTISPEASFVNMFGFVGAMLGGINGGLLYSRLSNLTFRESNEATVFESRGVAQRKMQDTMTLSFARGAVRFGVRYGIFCFGLSYVLRL